MILRDMRATDLDAVVAIERAVHAHPWTRGNFDDALRSGYQCMVAETEQGMLGYAVMLLGPDEAELLDIAVAADRQRQGWGGRLLGGMLILARRHGMRRAVLEVRVSNTPAIAMYRRQGFVEIGLRRDYYPALNGREDAMLMGCLL
ncbi:ribosomal protein S18-alanine N-acetyltransferase [Ferrigenium sp. UT4]